MIASVLSNPSTRRRRSGPSETNSSSLQSEIEAEPPPGTQTRWFCNRRIALRVRSARANWPPGHLPPSNVDWEVETISPTCLPSSSRSAVPTPSSSAESVAAMMRAILPASKILSGFRQRLTNLVGRPSVRFCESRRVAISNTSEKSALSEKFHCMGSWDVIKRSIWKSCSMRVRVWAQDCPVASVAGNTSAILPSSDLNRRATVATNAGPKPAVADACLPFIRLDNSSCIARRSWAGRLPNNRLPPTERVKGGFIITRSSSGRRAVSPLVGPRNP